MANVVPEILALLDEFPPGTTIEKRGDDVPEGMRWRLSCGVFAVYSETLAGLFDEASKGIIRMGVHAATEGVQV